MVVYFGAARQSVSRINRHINIGDQRAQADITVQNIAARQIGMRQDAIGFRQKRVNILLRDGGLIGVVIKARIGCRQHAAAHPWQHEKMFAIDRRGKGGTARQIAGDDMNALGAHEFFLRLILGRFMHHQIGPRARRVNGQGGAQFGRFAPQPVFHFDATNARAVIKKLRRFGIIDGHGTGFDGGAQHRQTQSLRRQHLPVMIEKAAGQLAVIGALQGQFRHQAFNLRRRQGAMSGHFLHRITAAIAVERQQVIKIKTGFYSPIAGLGIFIERQGERQRVHQMFGHALPMAAFAQALAHVFYVALGEIAQAAMNKFR